MDASGFEDEDLDEEANPLEPRSVMKSSSEATHRHLGASTGFGDKLVRAEGFSDRDSRRFEDDRGESRDFDHWPPRRSSDYSDRDRDQYQHERRDSGGYRDGSYRRFDREDRDFGRDYEDFDHRRNLDRGAWRDGGNS